MVSFESDYIAGAHPEVLKKLAETNLEPLPGYGSDPYCESAREKIRKELGLPEADVVFLAGGTQTNAVVISTMLADYEGVVAAKTGHISSHEAGAIEYTGHEVLELPQLEGKIDPSVLEAFLAAFYADENHEHMTFPGMVYISHPTEYGTLYSKAELTRISGICRQYRIPLFLDGARLGYALMSRETDVSLQDIAGLCDVFYIGGTKVGALLAKGRLLGVQFDALFTDGLYYRIGRYAIDMAEKMKSILSAHGIPFYIQSPTNQQFVILENSRLETFGRRIAYSFWEKADEAHTVIRLATSWSTTDEDLKALDLALA